MVHDWIQPVNDGERDWNPEIYKNVEYPRIKQKARDTHAVIARGMDILDRLNNSLDIMFIDMDWEMLEE